MKNLLPAVSAAIAGATAMYFLDPDQGRRRRAIVRDKAVSYSVHASDAARAQSRRVGNRLKGWTARAGAHLPLGHGTSPDPAKLERRVRSQLGRVVSHPKAIHVEAMEDRTICLTGHVLEGEMEALLEHVEAVPGVTRVDNRLTAHESAGHLPELQGEGRRTSRRNGRLWRMLAFAAPVAVLVATMRPSGRSTLHPARLWTRREPLGGLLGRARGLRRSRAWLHG